MTAIRGQDTALFVCWTKPNGVSIEQTIFTDGQIPRVGDTVSICDNVGDVRVKEIDRVRGIVESVEYIFELEAPSIGGKTRLGVVVNLASESLETFDKENDGEQPRRRLRTYSPIQ